MRPRRQRCPRCGHKHVLVQSEFGKVCLVDRAKLRLGSAFVPNKRKRPDEPRSTPARRKADDALTHTKRSARHGSNPL